VKILTLTNCPLDPTLGSGRTVLRYSEGLRRLGHSVDVLGPSDYEAWPSLGRGKQFRQAYGATIEVRRRVLRQRYDLLEFYGAEFWAVAMRLSRRADRPLLVAHTNGFELLDAERSRSYASSTGPSLIRLKRRLSGALQLRLMRHLFERTDALVTLCEADRRYAVSQGLYPVSHTAVVEPGLDEEFHALGAPEIGARETRVCYTGSWTPRKGITSIARTMSRVLERRPDVRFDVFGASGDRPGLLEAFPAALRPRVLVHPKLPNRDMVAALARGRVFFFPSEYEGYGMALAEAMACGLACVTTPTGLGADLTHGEEALVCGFGDIDAMTDAILMLLEDDSLCGRIANAGWRRVQSLRWETATARLSATYERWSATRQDVAR
jgi:glycosyltransferase involved in cell wall biosynthesis